LVTLTFPHTLGLPLESLLEKFSRALKHFKNSRTYKSIRERWAVKGNVRALETTYGQNGWHPHTHDLMFAGRGVLEGQPLSPSMYRGDLAELRDQWIASLLKVGLADRSQLNDLLEHAFQIQGGNFAGEYVAKFGHDPAWTEAHEVTKGLAKLGTRRIGGSAHLTPFQLLHCSSKGDKGAGVLFVEYARHFHGKRQLVWSPGLRLALFGEGKEPSDEQLAQEPLQDEEFVCNLDGDDWKLILERDAEDECLFWACVEGREGVRALREELRTRPRTHSGYFKDNQGFRGYG
jgi:hypothetical protein